MNLGAHTDYELCMLASRGDQKAFLVLYDRYKSGVQQHVSTFISQREEAEDVVLESFQKAFSQIESYNPEFRFSTWLFRIARNTAFDHIERSGRQSSNMPMNSIDDANAGLGNIIASSGDPEADVIRGQEYAKMVDAINGLGETYRKVAQMIFLENYGYQEVSDATGLPLNTVKTRVKRAKENLLRKLEDMEEEL
ncbi:MAG: sigma-70 family RNA polymerase sigma factor [Bacteroidales bacterium]|nr:sigma-70 family RNA polymerase sigma factor [Bacteroidales bacterium]